MYRAGLTCLAAAEARSAPSWQSSPGHSNQHQASPRADRIRRPDLTSSALRSAAARAVPARPANPPRCVSSARPRSARHRSSPFSPPSRSSARSVPPPELTSTAAETRRRQRRRRRPGAGSLHLDAAPPPLRRAVAAGGTRGIARKQRMHRRRTAPLAIDRE